MALCWFIRDLSSCVDLPIYAFEQHLQTNMYIRLYVLQLPGADFTVLLLMTKLVRLDPNLQQEQFLIPQGRNGPYVSPTANCFNFDSFWRMLGPVFFTNENKVFLLSVDLGLNFLSQQICPYLRILHD